jgi:nicotinamide/nicotinate riboside kinase
MIKPIEHIPYSSKYPGVQDWDDPPTCILWQEFRDTLSHLQQHGELPPVYQSRDHLNKQIEVEIDSAIKNVWEQRMTDVIEQQRAQGVELVWFIVDGFVLYWDKVGAESSSLLMIRSLQGLLMYRCSSVYPTIY